MLGATGKKPLHDVNLRYPATFVGNARPRGGGRLAVEALLETGEPFLVWGHGWQGRLPQKKFGGEYFDYGKLEELYAASEFSLNDHHPDMRRWGFVSFRLYDILASGGFAVSDRSDGIAEIFGDSIPQFSDGKELREIFSHYHAHPEERERLIKQGMKAALSHTWEKRAEQIRQHLLSVADPSTPSVAAPGRRSSAVDLSAVEMPATRASGSVLNTTGGVSLPLRLNVGCGSARREGYLNLDIYTTPAVDRVMPADELDLPDRCVAEIYTSHMVEHLNPAQLDSAAREWKRVMKPGGRLVVRCPNFEVYLQEWLNGNDEYRLGWGRINIFGHSDRGEGMHHRNGFSPGMLRRIFENHGFRTLKCGVSPTRPEYDGTFEYRSKGDIIYEGECLSDAFESLRSEATEPVRTKREPIRG